MRKIIGIILAITWSGCTQNPSHMNENPDADIVMNASLTSYISGLITEFDSIPEERKEQLGTLADYIRGNTADGRDSHLTYICTHNSRRSHMGQLWSQAASVYYKISGNYYSYSGGTEATAFNPRAVAAMERAGFTISGNNSDNPKYQVRYSESAAPMIAFSKKYDDPENPSDHFAAVMTCSDADRNCPFIPGAELRVSLPYDDPKESDSTDKESDVYDERCRQIAREMFYMMSLV